MDSGSQIPPIPSSNKFQLENESSRPVSSVSEYEPTDFDLLAPGVNHDKSMQLDVQYLELVSNFQSHIKKFRHSVYLDPSLLKSNVFSLLQTALVDLKAWAYDLSSDVDSVLSSLRDLSGGSSNLKTKLQQTMGNIGQSLELMEDEAYRAERNNSRSKSLDKLLDQCQITCDLIKTLQTLKPSVRKEMTASTSRERTTSTQRNTDPPPSVLSLDGGGVKSYASLLVLQRLMTYVNDIRGTQPTKPSGIMTTKPCDVFDFIFGSSSGGLLAIMLGRLQLTVEECIERFLAYSEAIFAHPRLSAKLLGRFSASKYDEEKIEQVTRRLVRDFDPTADHEKWKRNAFGISTGRCKTGVLATDARKTTSYMFRTYDCQASQSETPDWTPLNPGSRNMCQIWEAARATTAAPKLFPPIRIDETVFIDGGITANNPTQEALREVAYLHGNKLSGTCIVSIGSGVYHGPDLPALKISNKSHYQGTKTLVQILRAAATRTESTSLDVLFEASLSQSFEYFRLNTKYDRSILLDQWDKSRQVQAEIERSAKDYLDSAEAQESLRRCASILVSKLSRNVYFHPGNVHFYVPRPPNSVFVGRDEELHNLKLLLTSSEGERVGSTRILVITGMGGIGKSEICIKLAHDIREEFWGIFWVDIGTHDLAEAGFVAIAKILKSTVHSVHEAVQVLANTKKKWLLILDNANDPFIDYRRFFPPGQHGTVIITSRVADCIQYQTIGAVKIEALSNSALIELLMKSSSLPMTEHQSSQSEADHIIRTLGFHTLAVIQAGAYVRAGLCRLDEYAELFEQHPQRMLRYHQPQIPSRYGNLFSTFEVAASMRLNNQSEHGEDALCLLHTLGILHRSSLPFQIFENAWNGSQKVLNIDRPSTRSTASLTRWHVSHLPPFLAAEESGYSQWDPYRLNEASHLLESLALITRTNGDIAMHPLVHAWARDRQNEEQRAQSWLTAGCVIALSNYKSSFWQLNQSRLRAHIRSFLDVDLAMVMSRGQEDMVLKILLECGNIISQTRDDSNKEADRLFLQINEFSSRVLGQEHPDTLTSQANLASTYRHQGRWNEAENLELRVLETTIRVLGEEHPFTLIVRNNLVTTYCCQGRWVQAEKLGSQVMEISERVLGEEHPDTLTSMANLANIYCCQGRFQKAETLGVQAMETRKRVVGMQHPDTLSSMSKLMALYEYQGRWTEAEALGVQVIETRKRVLGKEHPDTLTSMANLMVVYENQGRWKQAEALGVNVVETRKRVLGKEHPDTLTSMANLAIIYGYQARWKEAEELGVQVLKLSKTVLGEEHPDTLSSMHALAIIYRDTGRLQEALRLMEEVVEARTRTLGMEHPDSLHSVRTLTMLQEQYTTEKVE